MSREKSSKTHFGSPKRRKLKVVNRAYTTDEPCVGAKKKPLIRMPLFFLPSSGEDGTMERVGPSIILIKPRVPRAQEKFVFVGGEKLREKRNV